jgi:hypothetical protein
MTSVRRIHSGKKKLVLSAKGYKIKVDRGIAIGAPVLIATHLEMKLA